METEAILKLWVFSCWLSAVAFVFAWMIWGVKVLKDEEIELAVATIRETREGYRQFEKFIRGVNGATPGEDLPASELIAMLAKKLGISERNLLYQLGQIPDERKG